MSQEQELQVKKVSLQKDFVDSYAEVLKATSLC